jgi:tRNA(fMet)-specific endonuclease VapC
VTDAIFDRAADLWVIARQGGYPHGDADLIIAATALEHARALVTGNTPHFAWIPGLVIADWRQP